MIQTVKKTKRFVFIARDIQTSVFPQYIIIRLWNQRFKNYVGMNARLGMANRKKVQEYFIPPKDWERLQGRCQQLAVQKKDFVKQTEKSALTSLRKLNTFTQQNIWTKDLSNLTNTQLSKLYSRFIELDEPCYAYGIIIFNFEFGKRAYFSNKIKQILHERAPKKEMEFFNILSVPSQSTIFYRQSLDILKLSYGVSKKKALKHVFRTQKPREILENIRIHHPAIVKELRRQQRAYHWLFHNWEGPVMEVEDFIMFVKDILRRGRVQKEYEAKRDELKMLSKLQKEIMTKLKFSKEESWYVDMAQFAYWFQPFRKANQFKSCWHLHKLFREAAQRLHVSVDQVRYMTHEELGTALRTGTVDLQKINERRKLFVCTYIGKKFTILEGKKAKAYIEKNVELVKHRSRPILHGTPACTGTARGAVHIVNSLAEAQNFKRGDILVSYATNPTLLAVMRQASAIVTEEGGLTCHAAIVSRELNVPCVVGVDGVVSNLKNGTKVSVDAHKGIVKKIKK